MYGLTEARSGAVSLRSIPAGFKQGLESLDSPNSYPRTKKKRALLPPLENIIEGSLGLAVKNQFQINGGREKMPLSFLVTHSKGA
jgi:hypothetical protein